SSPSRSQCMGGVAGASHRRSSERSRLPRLRSSSARSSRPASGPISRTRRRSSKVDELSTDTHLGGSQLGKGGPLERAAPFAILTSGNEKNSAAFDLTQRYAFGFEAVKATAGAMNINFHQGMTRG